MHWRSLIDIKTTLNVHYFFVAKPLTGTKKQVRPNLIIYFSMYVQNNDIGYIL